MIKEDLDALFSGPDAVDVIYGESVFKGLLDTPDQIIGGGTMLSTEYGLLVKSSCVQGVNEYDSITVDGGNFEIRSVSKVDDGLLTRILLNSQESG